MDDEKPYEAPLALPSPAPAKSGALGGFALVVSILALCVSGYVLMRDLTAEPPLPQLPTIQPVVDTSALEDRMAKQEERQGHFAEDIAKLSQIVEGMGKNPVLAEAVAPKVDNTALEAELRTALSSKTKLLSDWALLQGMRIKLREGVDFSAERKGLGTEIQAAAMALENMKPHELSDKKLQDELRALAPQFGTMEKMQEANGFVQRLMVRAQSLVTIRPKNAVADTKTASGPQLAALDAALQSHDWAAATTIAGELGAKGPQEFAVFQERLRQRVEAESALEGLQKTALSAMRDEPAAAKPHEASP